MPAYSAKKMKKVEEEKKSDWEAAAAAAAQKKSRWAGPNVAAWLTDNKHFFGRSAHNVVTEYIYMHAAWMKCYAKKAYKLANTSRRLSSGT